MLVQVVAKKRVNTRTWECCNRMNEVLQQLEHEARKVEGFVCFSTLDVLDYLHREAAQPNDHDQRILIGNIGLSSADGLGLLLCSLVGAEMERDGGLTGGANLHRVPSVYQLSVGASRWMNEPLPPATKTCSMSAVIPADALHCSIWYSYQRSRPF